MATLEELLSGSSGPYTPETPASAFKRGSYLTPEELQSIQGFAGVKRDPKGNYGGFDSNQVTAFQNLYNRLSPESQIKVDGVHGDQTAAAAYDLLSRYGNGSNTSPTTPSYTPTQETPKTFDEYNGKNPVYDIIEQFKPKKNVDTERMSRAAGFAALASLLRNVVDGIYAPKGAQVVEHSDPQWVMNLAKRVEQLKDRDKNEDIRYNTMRLNQTLRDKDRYNAYLDKIDDRNYASREFGNRQNFENSSKEYWYNRQRGDSLSDYNRNKADRDQQFERQFTKQKELAKFNSGLQESALERRMKFLKDNGMTSSGKKAGSSGGGGKPFMTYYDSGNGRNVPLTDGQAMEVVNWAFKSNLITEHDLSAMRQSFNGVGSKNEVVRLVQKAMPSYLKATGGSRSAVKTSEIPKLLQREAKPVDMGKKFKSIQVMVQGGLSQEEAQKEYDDLSNQGYSDEDIYNYLSQ